MRGPPTAGARVLAALRIAAILECDRYRSAVARLRALASDVTAVNAAPDPGGRAPLQLDQQPRWRSTADAKYIPSSVQDVRKHLAEAGRIEVPAAVDLEDDTPSDLLGAVEAVASRRAGVVGWRRVKRAELQRISRDLQPLTRQIRAEVTPGHLLAAGPRIAEPHVALVAALTEALGLADAELHEALALGAPAVGDIPAAGVSAWRRGAEARRPVRLRPTRAEDDAWNAWLRADVETRPPSLRDADVWAATMAELDKGLIDGPWSFADIEAMFGESGWRGSRRFPVDQDGKCRPCEDCAESGLNAMTGLQEKITCVLADFPARVAARFVEALGWEGEEWTMLLATDDLASAYRVFPCSTPGHTVFVQRNPATGEAAYFTMAGFNFGLASAVNQFNRLPEFSVAVARRLFGVCTAHYFDDFPTAEPDFAGDSGQLCLTELHAEIGFPFEPRKSTRPAGVRVFLGVESDFRRLWSDGVVEMAVPAERAERTTGILGQILRTRWLPASLAATVCGKVQFLTTWAYGRVGRAAMQPLHRRRSEKRGFDGLDDAAAAAVGFLHSLIPVLPRRVIRLRGTARPAVRLWTDAMWEEAADEPARIGIVVHLPGYVTEHGRTIEGKYLHASMVVPSDVMEAFVERRQYIGQLELLAAVAAYTTFADELRGRRVIHWIDNTSALAALIKGYSRAPDSARIVHAFHAFNVGLRASCWLEYVASKANIADMPSRGDFGLLEELGSEERECILPPTDSWDEAAGEWMRRAAARADLSGCRSRRPGHGEDGAQRPRRRQRRGQGGPGPGSAIAS